MPTETRHATEQAYDEEMAPLVAKLIAIAKERGIPLLVSAGMLDEDGEHMGCTTLIPEANGFRGFTNRMQLCSGILRGDTRFDTASSMQITRYHTDRE